MRSLEFLFDIRLALEATAGRILRTSTSGCFMLALVVLGSNWRVATKAVAQSWEALPFEQV